MKIYISGAHRSGKTTLAKALAEKLGLTYLDANVSGILKEMGVDKPNDNVEATEAAIHAKRQLDVAKALHQKFKDEDNFVTDRSLLDVYMYTVYGERKLLSELPLTETWYYDRIESWYIEDTYAPTRKYIEDIVLYNNDLNIIVQPSIDVEFTPDDKSGAQGSQYQLNEIIKAHSNIGYDTYIMNAEISGVPARLEAVDDLMTLLEKKKIVREKFS